MSYWIDKVVVITGGSSGFGLALARQYCAAGAIVGLLARDKTRCQAAIESLLSEGGCCFGMSVEMNDPESVERAVKSIVEQRGRIDCWVNNVGQSTRVPAAEASESDYRQSLDANFFTAYNGSMAALPHLIQSEGHLLNIGSLSSKTAWPFVGPYTVSKHALAGFTSQLRVEFGERVHVMLVCPGPMARLDAGTRYDEKTESLPDSARQPGAGAPVSLLDPDRLAARVVKLCGKRRPELVVPGKARILFSVQQLFPRLGNWILGRLQK